MRFSKNETWKKWLDELMKVISQTSGGLVDRASFPNNKTIGYPNASMFDSRLAESYYRPSGKAINPLAAAYDKSPMARYSHPVPLPKLKPVDLEAEIQDAASKYLSNLTRIKDLDTYLSNSGVGQVAQSAWESVFGKNPVIPNTVRGTKRSTPKVNTATVNQNMLMQHLSNPNYYRGETRSSYGPLFDNFPLANIAKPTSSSAKGPRRVPQTTGLKVVKEPWEKGFYGGILSDKQNSRLNADSWSARQWINELKGYTPEDWAKAKKNPRWKKYPPQGSFLDDVGPQ
jgi:hypothetical protein